MTSAAKSWVKRRAHRLGSIVRTTSEHLVLTYDDGPDVEHTRGILAALDEHRATATFFVLLTRTRRHPEILREIVAGGHEIGLHGPDHRRLTELGYRDARKRTQEAKAELEDAVGHDVRWFRPPYGSQSLWTWQATRAVGLIPVLWSATTWDWRELSQDERLAEAVRGGQAGAILLAHDGFAGPDDGVEDGPAPTGDRAELARLVLGAVHERGLRGVSLGEALKDASAVTEARFSTGGKLA